MIKRGRAPLRPKITLSLRERREAEAKLRELRKSSELSEAERQALAEDRALAEHKALAEHRALKENMAAAEAACGECLKAATIEAPRHAKARLRWGNWCYRHGSAAVEKLERRSGRCHTLVVARCSPLLALALPPSLSLSRARSFAR